MNHTNNNKFSNAIDDYSQVIDLDKNFDLAYFLRGNIFAELGEIDKAINDWTFFIQIQNSSIWLENAYSNRAKAYRQKGMFKNAIGDLKSILQFKPDHPNRAQIEQIITDLEIEMNK